MLLEVCETLMTSTSEKKRVQKSSASDEVAERLGKAKKKRMDLICFESREAVGDLSRWDGTDSLGSTIAVLRIIETDRYINSPPRKLYPLHKPINKLFPRYPSSVISQFRAFCCGNTF